MTRVAKAKTRVGKVERWHWRKNHEKSVEGKCQPRRGEGEMGCVGGKSFRGQPLFEDTL